MAKIRVRVTIKVRVSISIRDWLRDRFKLGPPSTNTRTEKKIVKIPKKILRMGPENPTYS